MHLQVLCFVGLWKNIVVFLFICLVEEMLLQHKIFLSAFISIFAEEHLPVC